MNNRTDYLSFKEYLFSVLQQMPQPLEPGAIESKIQDTKKQIEILSRVMVFREVVETISPLLKGVSEMLDETDFIRLQNDLEESFNVRMDEGILIKGDSNKRNDEFWWTNRSRSNGDSYYWERYGEELLKLLNKQVRDSINESTDVIMNNIGDPSDNFFEQRGMVVGHVQSGKTAHYSSLVCKAADAGYKFIVVIAGDKRILRSQTQKRLNEHFIGWDGEKQVGVGVGRDRLEKRPISLTRLERDFNKREADQALQGANFDNVKVPILLVIKKDPRTLSNVIKWLKKQYKNKVSNHSMLLIDDESDYASINTKDEDSPTRINERIRELLSLFEKRSYVAYTATPYANILIDHLAFNSTLGEDLFPRDFIYVLEAPDNYFGAKKVFIENEESIESSSLVIIDDYEDVFPPKHKKDLEIYELPDSLKEALRLFFINVAIRDLRGYTKKHNSMMIHASRFTNVHQKIKFLVGEYSDQIKKEVCSYGNLINPEKFSNVLYQMHETYKKFHSNKGQSWNEVLHRIVEICDTVLIREVHKNTPAHLRLKYPDDSRINVIVIGGASVSRGYTLEGLSVSYFLRTTIYYDTLMQMGRWFGYRIGYDDLCKVFLPRTVRDNFVDIIESTNELFDDFRRMANENMTPNEFGLAIQYRPESALQVTARNKQRNASDLVIEMKLDGLSKETARIHVDPLTNQKNNEEIRKFLMKLGNRYNKDGKRYLWRNVEKSFISDFLNQYQFITYDQYTFNMRMPVDFIKEYVETSNTNWDIALYNGSGEVEPNLPMGIIVNRETRKIEYHKNTDKYYEIRGRQVSTGNSELIALTDDEISEMKRKGIKLNRKNTRAQMTRPLLMLHFLELPEKEVNTSMTFPAIGFSFPTYLHGDTESYWSNPIQLKINSVYAQQLQEELELEEEVDE